NYLDHAEEAGLPAPTEPVLFIKACTLTGPDDDIQFPATSTKLDWEIELAIVVGRRALNISREQAADHIAGYATFIDLSARDWQLERGGNWDKGKSYPGFAPIGPWLRPASEVDEGALGLTLSVNGKTMQDGNTGKMIFPPDVVLSYLSEFIELMPGDVIATGTPAGVGMGLKPPIYLEGGDRIVAEVTGLGAQHHLCRR
ncbi:MAG: FAA hydrolase family protein, partial [Sphingomonadales bacterium]